VAAGWLAWPRPALAAGGPVLDAPAVVQAHAAVPVALTYAPRKGACGGEVLFTWDSLPWGMAAPTGGGTATCTAAISSPPPAGSGSGTHQVCGFGVAGGACRTLTVVVASSPAPTPPTSPPRPRGATPAATTAPQGPTPVPSATSVLAVGSPEPPPGDPPSPAPAVVPTPLPAGTAPPVAGISAAVLLAVVAAAGCALLVRSLLRSTQP